MVVTQCGKELKGFVSNFYCLYKICATVTAAASSVYQQRYQTFHCFMSTSISLCLSSNAVCLPNVSPYAPPARPKRHINTLNGDRLLEQFCDVKYDTC